MFPRLTTVLSLASLALAAPIVLQDLQVSESSLVCERSLNSTLYDCTLSFHVYDPNAAAYNETASASCNQTWLWDSVTAAQGASNNYSSEYVVCYNDGEGRSLQASLTKFESASDMAVKLVSSFVTNSARTDFRTLFTGSNDLSLSPMSITAPSKVWKSSSVEKFPVVGMSA